MAGADQRKHQNSASLAFVLGIHRWPVNSHPKRPVTRKMFLFEYVIMKSSIRIFFRKKEKNTIQSFHCFITIILSSAYFANNIFVTTTRVSTCGSFPKVGLIHYSDVIVSTMASHITSLTFVYSTLYWGADQRKHQSSASMAFVRGIHRWLVNSLHTWPVTRKLLPFDDVIMNARCWSPHNKQRLRKNTPQYSFMCAVSHLEH